MIGPLKVTIVGSAVVFALPGRDVLYKVELCEVMAAGDYRMAACFERASQAWRPCELHREHHGTAMAEIERQAAQMSPDAATWSALIHDAPPLVPEHERISELASLLMKRHQVGRKAIAARLGIKDRTFREYCEGTSRGTQGDMILLALEALASRSQLD